MMDDKKNGVSEQKKKQPHAGHRSRMRARFAESGFDGYQNHEMLEQLLYESYTRMNTNGLAHVLLDRFETLEGVLTASPEELIQVEGIGERSAELIRSVWDTADRYIREQFAGIPMEADYAPFLTDWFLFGKPDSAVCWIECDSEGRIADIRVEEVEPERDSLMRFGRSMTGKRGVLLVRCGKKLRSDPAEEPWSGEVFAFLDGMLSADGGGLSFACVLRGRKLLRCWKGIRESAAEPFDSPLPETFDGFDGFDGFDEFGGFERVERKDTFGYDF